MNEGNKKTESITLVKVIQAESESDEENIMENNHVRVVNAFDEMVSELESVSLVPKCRSLIRPSSIKQRPQSAYVSKAFSSSSSSGISSPEMDVPADRDSGTESVYSNPYFLRLPELHI